MNPIASIYRQGLQPSASPIRFLRLVFAFCVFILTLNTTLLYGQAAPDLASQLAIIDNAVPGAPIYKTAEATKQGFANCLKESIKTEFDTADTLLAKATKTPCRFAGITTFKGRGDSVYGDLLKYDSQKQAVFWSMPIKPLDNLISGHIASPYDLNSKDDTKTLTKEQKSEIKGVNSISYVLFPLYGDKDTSRVYEGSNAFGAKTQVTELSGTRFSLAVKVGKQMGLVPRFW